MRTFALSLASLLLLVAGAIPSEAATIYSGDRDALLQVKVGFEGSTWVASLLKSWSKSNANCTAWYGVTCNAAGRVTKIQLSNQQLEGTLSYAIGKLVYLEVLELSLNYLTGNIPNSIGNLTRLKTLDLSEQDKPFGGHIPQAIGRLTNLETLYLAFNKFNGTLPASIGNLTKLKVLGLHYNNLEGRIPATIKALTKLQELRLYENYFTGSLAIDANFTTAYVFNNYFSGPLSITVNGGKAYCGAITAGNCVFPPNTLAACGAAKDQKSKSVCANFCHANAKEGACGGHGTCDSVTATCTCAAGYKLTLDKKYCYK